MTGGDWSILFVIFVKYYVVLSVHSFKKEECLSVRVDGVARNDIRN